jgi:hypothetical protein
MASGVSLERVAGVFSGVGTMRRGVVWGGRLGVVEVIGVAGVNLGGAITSVDSAGEAVSAGLGGGTSRRGRAEGESNTEGVDISVAVVRAVGTGVGDAGLGIARGVGAAATEGIGLETATGVVRAVGAAAGDTGLEDATGLAPAVAAAGVMPVVLIGAGFTNVLGGASAGAAASAFIFARARSAAGRSVSAAQLFSTVASLMVSFTVCGRSTPGTLVIGGAEMTRTSPRTVAGTVVSEFACRSRRYRSIGCRLRERISSKFGPWLTTVVFAKVMLVTLVVPITIVILRSTGTTDCRMRRDPNSFSGTNAYWSGPIS